MNRFIDTRKNNWERLEDLLSLTDLLSLSKLSKAEVREFGELYRRAASDLAIARSETRDPKLINYLNSLVIRAHGKIYRADSSGATIIWQFFARDFPRAFRRTLPYITLAFAVFTFFGLASFLLCYTDADFAERLGLDGVRIAARSNERWWLSLNEANQIGSSKILTNNILVTFMAFAYGAIFGVGTLYVLISNALSIGGVLGVCYKTNPEFGAALVTFMVGHGVIELSCIFFCAGAGMTLGWALVNPGDSTRAEALKKRGLEAARVVFGAACLLVVAGVIEGFLSPSNLPPIVKYLTGISTGIAMYSYLFLAGREKVISDK